MKTITFVAVAALFAAAPAARAQSAPLAPEGVPVRTFVSAPAAATSGPALSSSAAGARPVAATDVRASALEAESSALRRRARFNEAQTLMIVGGAAFIAGALIGDDAGTIVMVGGAAVGLYGLYLYLQQ